jgi:hypothetical protein
MNQHTGQSRMRQAGRYHRRFSLAAAVAAAAMLAACPVLAQGWWPWSDSEREEREEEGPPIPDEPVYRDPQAPSQYPPSQHPSSEYPSSDQPPPSAPPAANWSTKNPICLQLEQRLIQEGQRTSQSRDAIPKLEADIRQVDQLYQQSERELERRSCYEYFLFSKSLRRTRACFDLSQQKDQAKRQLADLEAQRQQIAVSSEQSYRDDIVRELAHNNCGANYVQEARRQDGDSSSSIWQDDEGNYANTWSPYGGSSSATYRTLCVRLCDGYYFPVSFSTLPSHFEQDEAVCRSKCAAPVELYYYQNPGAAVDQSVALRTQEPYTSLKSAFRYRKELVNGCSCKAAEFDPQSKPADGKRAEGAAPPATGWETQPKAQTAPR